jgi:hypothetical protein
MKQELPAWVYFVLWFVLLPSLLLLVIGDGDSKRTPSPSEDFRYCYIVMSEEICS